MALAALLIAGFALLVSVVSVMYARKQANHAAAMAAIESGRRHQEQEPVFEIEAKEAATAPGRAQLSIRLTAGAPELDAVTVTILDEADQDHWGDRLPEALTREQADMFVWGPWEFDTNVREIVDCRTSAPQPLSLLSGQNWARLPLQRTRPGAWMSMTEAVWRSERTGPIRLRLTCLGKGEEPWVVLKEIHVQGLGQVASAASRRLPPLGGR
jgi:hypothetical protein